MSPVRFVIALLFVASACGGGGKESPPDAPEADAFVSICGQPGDTGNEMGIGKFCASLVDCADTQAAPLCSSLGDKSTHFCTHRCQQSGPADQCGTGAECTCDSSNQCGCTPSSCLDN